MRGIQNSLLDEPMHEQTDNESEQDAAMPTEAQNSCPPEFPRALEPLVPQ